MKRNVILLISVCAASLAMVAFLWSQADLGVKSGDIVQDAREEQQVPGNWSVAQDTGDCMSAMLFYSGDKNDFTVAIYTKASEASDKYHYRFGGDSGMIDTGIVEYAFDDCSEQAFLSLNNQQAVRAEIYRGQNTETVELDGDKPFVLIVDMDAEKVLFFDADGNNAGDYELETQTE